MQKYMYRQHSVETNKANALIIHACMHPHITYMHSNIHACTSLNWEFMFNVRIRKLYGHLTIKCIREGLLTYKAQIKKKQKHDHFHYKGTPYPTSSSTNFVNPTKKCWPNGR